jgi:4-amino-4-deoxy-L-arabinose transferase-like glycosyltransferase
MPGGLFPDMAANGLDINLMQSGQIQPFYERGNGREALFFYMEWASAALFGKGVWQFSIVSALVGVLSVIVCFGVTRRLFITGFEFLKESEYTVKLRRATNIALLASFLMAVNSWYVVLSRTAFRANLIPLFAGITVYFLLCTYQAKTNRLKLIYSFLTGAFFALGFYTYIAYRILVGIIAIALIWPWIFNGFTEQIRKYWRATLIFFFAFCIFIFPLAKYFYQHPGSFIGRSGQVIIFNPELYLVNGEQMHGKPPILVVLSALGEVAKKSLLGFFTQGDLNWRHNISGWPFLSQLVSPFFGVGLITITFLAIGYVFMPRKKQHWWKYFILTGWFWGMLLPVITTAEGIPHGLRSIGMIPPVFIIAAWTLYYLAEFVWTWHAKIWQKCLSCHLPHYESIWRFFSRNLAAYGLKLVAVCFFAALILQTYFGYFVYAKNSPENFYYFRSDLTPVSQYLLERCNKDSTYLVLDKFSVQTTDYLTSDPHGNFFAKCNVPYSQVDPENSWELKNLKIRDQIVFAQSSIFDTRKFKQYHPQAYLKMQLQNQFGQTVLAVYEIAD